MDKNIKDAYLAEQNSYKRSIDRLNKEIGKIEEKIQTTNIVAGVSGAVSLVSAFLMAGHSDYNTTMHIADNLTDPFNLISLGAFTLGAVTFMLANKQISRHNEKIEDKENLIDEYSEKIENSIEAVRREEYESSFLNSINEEPENPEDIFKIDKDEPRDLSSNDELVNSKNAFGVTEEEWAEAKENSTPIIKVIHGNQQGNEQQDDDAQGLNE